RNVRADRHADGTKPNRHPTGDKRHQKVSWFSVGAILDKNQQTVRFSLRRRFRRSPSEYPHAAGTRSLNATSLVNSHISAVYRPMARKSRTKQRRRRGRRERGRGIPQGVLWDCAAAMRTLKCPFVFSLLCLATP